MWNNIENNNSQEINTRERRTRNMPERFRDNGDDYGDTDNDNNISSASIRSIRRRIATDFEDDDNPLISSRLNSKFISLYL
jgi:hypothetical protein